MIACWAWRSGCRSTVSAEILRSPRTHPPLASKKLPVFMRVCGVARLVIESPKPPNCHPEREGGGWGGREGSPHKSWCRSTVIAEILRSPRAHPPIAQDDTKIYSVSSLRFSARAVKGLRMTLIAGLCVHPQGQAHAKPRRTRMERSRIENVGLARIHVLTLRLRVFA
jgi:hypothetical protein